MTKREEMGSEGHLLCTSDKQPAHGQGRKLNTHQGQQPRSKRTCAEACWFGIKLHCLHLNKESDLPHVYVPA